MPTKTAIYKFKCLKCGFASQTTVLEEVAVEPHKVSTRFRHGATIRYWSDARDCWVEGDLCDVCLDSGDDCIDG